MYIGLRGTTCLWYSIKNNVVVEVTFPMFCVFLWDICDKMGLHEIYRFFESKSTDRAIKLNNDF